MSGKHYTTRDIAAMRRIYGQTMSLSATARACRCNTATVKKYRDEQNWVIDQEVKELAKRPGNDVLLTTDIANTLASGWRIHMMDKDLCNIVNITPKQLSNWLYNNTECTVIRTYKTGEKDDKGNDVTGRRTETIGLKELKEKEWSNFEFSQVQIQLNLQQMASNAGQYGVAAGIGQYLLEKKIPHVYGQKAQTQININNQTQNNFVKIDTLDLDIETRRKILSKLREQKELQALEENVSRETIEQGD